MTEKNVTASSSSARRYGVGALLAVALGSAGLGAFGLYLVKGATPPKAEDAGLASAKAPATPRYLCPMHPSITSDKPDDCPICGMKLVPAAQGTAPEKEASAKAQYICPMHPSITSDRPGDCPICGMKLVPVEPKEGAAGTDLPEGQVTVDIDPARQQLIGMKIVAATDGDIGGAWRTVGRVAVDETRVRHVNVKVPGFVERVYADFVGKQVRKGDPLFTVYSPELLSAQEEYLLALRTRGALPTGGALAGDGEALVNAARRKLSLWDVPESEIARLEKSGTTTKTLTVYSPVSGVVTRKDVVDGMKLDAGAMPYELVDLSTVWVLADVYESELRFAKKGMAATLTLNAFPNHEFKGKVLFVDPMLDPKSRTVKLRLAFPNPDGDLRPEMFGDVVLHGTPTRGLRIPKDAVIDSGIEKFVFVALGGGKFQPRQVRLGDADSTNVEVLSGLVAGEEVVTRANFLVDSESKLRASLAESAGAHPKTPTATPPPEPAQHGHEHGAPKP